MNDVIGFILCLCIAVLALVLLYVLRKLEREESKEARSQQERQSAEELVLVEEDPKVAALRGYVRSSIQNNMLTMESLKRMDEVARMHRTGEPASRDLQNEAWYRHAEGMDQGQNHRPL